MSSIPNTVTLVATGCSSGLGLASLLLLVARPAAASSPFHLLLGSRSSSAPGFEELSKVAEANGHQVTILHLDLAWTESVKAFAAQVVEILGEVKINVLLECAAVYKAERTMNVGGWSEEAIVNHFAQHYLVHLLAPHLAPVESGTNDSRIVVVSSRLHRGIESIDALPSLLKCTSAPEAKEAMKRYAATKFVQLIGAQWWRKRLAGSSLVIAVSPGFVPQTGLNRESSFFLRFFLHYILSWAPFCSTVGQGSESILRAITLTDEELDALSATVQNTEVDGQGGDFLLYLDVTGKAQSADARTNGVGLEDWTPSLEEIERWRRE